MKNRKTTKYRLILTLSDQDIAFERLYFELLDIDNKFFDAESINNAKRKHFLKILLEYCNPHAANAYKTLPFTAEAIDPPSKLAPSPPPTPPPDTHASYANSEEVTPPTGLHKPDGSISFGKFQLKTY